MSSLAIWHPQIDVDPLDGGALQRDFQKAVEQWGGEEHVWLLPELEEKKHFQSEDDTGFNRLHLSLPAETYNHFWVWHVKSLPKDVRVETEDPQTDKPRFGIWPPIAINEKTVWKRLPAPSLYQHLSDCSAHFDQLPENATYPRPKFQDDQVTMESCTTELEPRGWMDLFESGDTDETFKLSPHTKGPPPVHSVDDESVLERFQDSSFIRNQSGEKGLALFLRWENPLRRLHPNFAGYRFLLTRTQIEECFELNESENPEKLERANRKAKTQLEARKSKSYTTQERGLIMPQLMAVEGISYEIKRLADRLKLQDSESIDSINSLKNYPSYHSTANERMEVTVLLGWDGFMWWEVCRDLNEPRHQRLCQNCGGLLVGGREDRKYCDSKFEPYKQAKQCKKERERKRKRKQREQ